MGKLSKEVFKKQMVRLKVLYPNWNINLQDSNVIKIWYKEFSDMTDEEFKTAIDEYIDHQVYTPTIAGIRQQKTFTLPADEYI